MLCVLMVEGMSVVVNVMLCLSVMIALFDSILRRQCKVS